MELSTKLRLIQEGFTIDQINTGNVKPLSIISEAVIDDLTLFTESMSVDFNYVTQMSMNMLQESDADKNGIFKRFIAWLIEKIRHFKTFIMHMFKKKKQESYVANSVKLKKLITTEFKPFMIKDNFDRVINDPNSAISILKGLVDKFEDVNAGYVDYAYTGKGYNDEIQENTDINGMQIVIWRKVLNGAPISYDKSVTPNAIDFSLNKSMAIRIQSKEQIQNIITFSESFYDLWKDMHQALGYYEGQLANLSSMADDGFKIVQLLCETMLHTFPEILSYVNAHINKLTMIEKYI